MHVDGEAVERIYVVWKCLIHFMIGLSTRVNLPLNHILTDDTSSLNVSH